MAKLLKRRRTDAKGHEHKAGGTKVRDSKKGPEIRA
jgi:hypothetical protein